MLLLRNDCSLIVNSQRQVELGAPVSRERRSKPEMFGCRMFSLHITLILTIQRKKVCKK